MAPKLLPEGLGSHVQERFESLAREDVIPRIWARDHTVWSDDPTEITEPDRLGWLTIAAAMRAHVPDLQRFAAQALSDGFENVLLLGMGGSSLAAEVLAQAWAGGSRLKLHVLDTTVPAEIIAVEREIDLARTLFIVASKSGTTIETSCQLAYFWDKLPSGRNFIAITDPGTPLEALAKERKFRRVFLNPPSIGGRYSALSFFGLVPGVLAGADVQSLLDSAGEMQRLCSESAPQANPGARLGAVLGEAALAGRDKLTLIVPETLSSLGEWLEQLIAESTGKHGKGIIPVVGERLGSPDVYGDDRLFVAYGDVEGLVLLEGAGQPVVRLPLIDRSQLGAEFFRWQFATAIAGHVLAINPFDQPNVQSAKDATARILQEAPKPVKGAPLPEVLARLSKHDYIAVLAYLPRAESLRARLGKVRHRLRDRYGVATTLGFGPRYLHSMGQVHKGGPNSGVFIQIVDDSPDDIPVPGRPFGFRRLMQAQADGDFEALRAAGRRAARATVEQLEEAVR